MSLSIEKAMAVQQKGDLQKARKMYKKILKRHPENPDCLSLLANLDLIENNPKAAEQKLRRIIKQAPEEIRHKVLLAEILYQLGKFDELENCCHKILRKDNTNAAAYNLLGLLAITKVEYEDAMEKFSMAMKLEMPNLPAMQNYALVLHRIGKNEFSEKYSRAILKLQPDNIGAKINLGMALRCQGKLEEAKDIFHSIKDNPKARFNYGFIQLMQKNLKDGFENYQAWKLCKKPPESLNQPEWDGGTYPGKTLLVTAQQGLGDTILMSRFFPQLKPFFKNIIIQPGQPLIRLIESMDQEFLIAKSIQGQEYDFWCDVMDLPYKLGIENVDQIPLDPWFTLKAAIPESNKLKVGINWAGNPSYLYDRIRSTSLNTFASLFEIPGVDWYSLHKGCREHEAKEFNLHTPLDNAKDFYDTAAVINGLDMVISTETAVPNLAGALGVPTCVLTNIDVDWRWDSWYENIRVCQQKTQGDWSEPVRLARETLEAFLKLKTSGLPQYLTF